MCIFFSFLIWMLFVTILATVCYDAEKESNPIQSKE
jgi:hypothetical protein